METTIAIVYGTDTGGGIGDVGKYALAHALKAPGVNARPIAMTSRATAEPSFEIEVDVEPESLQQDLNDALKDVQPAKLVVEDADTASQLESLFEGVDAVIACVGNRQPGSSPALKSRWCELGAKKIQEAMAAKQVKRLVLLSSFGLGDDLVPFSLLKGVWETAFRSLMPAARRDLQAMEKVTQESGLDYLLVRAAALYPTVPITGKWKLLKSKGEKLSSRFFFVSKSDVGLFMLEEACKPTMHSTAITIGSSR